jgi:hypothetical protein
MVFAKRFIKSQFPKLFQIGKLFQESHSRALGKRYPKWAEFHRFDEGIERYAFPKDGDIRQDLMNKYGSSGDLAQIFTSNVDSLVHKWHHYIPIYEKYLEKYRGQEVRILEIGVSKGGSLRMWREYFGPNAVIFGIDIDESCYIFNGVHAEVRIGSQDDPEFLSSVVLEMGGIDVVLDDGSHNMRHILASLNILFPRLKQGGTYLVEDLHTAYWRGYGGGYQSKDNFFKKIPRLIDDIHSWYHPYGKRSVLANHGVTSIHIHDSIVVLEKDTSYPPTHSFVGFEE